MSSVHFDGIEINLFNINYITGWRTVGHRRDNRKWQEKSSFRIQRAHWMIFPRNTPGSYPFSLTKNYNQTFRSFHYQKNDLRTAVPHIWLLTASSSDAVLPWQRSASLTRTFFSPLDTSTWLKQRFSIGNLVFAPFFHSPSSNISYVVRLNCFPLLLGSMYQCIGVTILINYGKASCRKCRETRHD